MKQRELIVVIGILAGAALGLFTNCTHYSVRSPENYVNLIKCKSDADQVRENHRDKVLTCLPLADTFAKSQELYSLDQDELLEAFNALYGVYFYQKDRGASDLAEIFLRFEEKNRSKDMARNVLAKYLMERDFAHATEFVSIYPIYKLEMPPKILGVSNPQKMETYRILDRNTLSLEEFHMPKDPTVLVVFHPDAHVCQNFYKDLMKNKVQYKNALKHMTLIYPQEGSINAFSLKWGLEHSPPTVRLVYKETAFNELMPDWSATPIIYFFNKQGLQYTMHGWTKEGSAFFREGLKRIDLQ